MDEPHRGVPPSEPSTDPRSPGGASTDPRSPGGASTDPRSPGGASTRLRVPGMAGLAVLALCGGCEGCPGDKPFTPYTLDGSTSASPPGSAAVVVGDAGSDADAGPHFTAIAAAKAPGDGRDWALPGGKMAPAPAGRAWEWGLVADLDGDGTEDLLAWAGAPDHLRGELWFVPASALDARRPVVGLPADMSAPSCDPQVALARIGPRSAALDISLECPRAGREPERWVAVVRLPEGAARAGDAGPPVPALLSVALELRFLRPPPTEALAVSLDGSDLDGDGRDDVTATSPCPARWRRSPRRAARRAPARRRWRVGSIAPPDCRVIPPSPRPRCARAAALVVDAQAGASGALAGVRRCAACAPRCARRRAAA
ncbi:MAG: hypothetical protein WKG00_37740 [Polyangiaceae bacterium]